MWDENQNLTWNIIGSGSRCIGVIQRTQPNQTEGSFHLH